MNSQTTKDITGFRSYFPDVLRLIFEEQLSVRAIALEQLGLSHSTVHNIFRKRLVRTVLIFTESSDQLSRATDRVPGLPASPGYVQ
ncbi:response regulator transcription factor [Escherichia coli]|nr:response regulator transcription factor [Escherichia coli]